MKYDPSTANVDRWHGFSEDDFSRGFQRVEMDTPDAANNKNNLRQLNGGMIERDDDIADRTD